MSAENKKLTNQAPAELDPALKDLAGQVEGPSSFEEEQLLLLNFQTMQQQALEKNGIAAKARDLLTAKNENVLELRQGMLEHAMGLAGDDEETLAGGPLPPELTADISGDNTRLSVVVTSASNRGEIIVERPSILFTTTELGDDGEYHAVRQLVPVAEGFTDGAVPAESFRPMPGFNDEDVRVVVSQLTKVREAQAQGLLPHIGPALASIQEPADISRAMMAASATGNHR